jgi:hypothetical protein
MLAFAQRTFCRRTELPRGRAPPLPPRSNCALPNPGAAFTDDSPPRDAAGPIISGDVPVLGAHRPPTPRVKGGPPMVNFPYGQTI